MSYDKALLDDTEQVMIVPHCEQKWYTYEELYDMSFRINPKITRMLYGLNELGRRMMKMRRGLGK